MRIFHGLWKPSSLSKSSLKFLAKTPHSQKFLVTTIGTDKMKSIEEIFTEAVEKASRDLETFVYQHGYFSGSDPEDAGHMMLSKYDRTLWETILSMVQEHIKTEKKNFSIDTLLLELHKKGVDVVPTCFSIQKRIVNTNNTLFIVNGEEGGIHIERACYEGVTLAVDEAIIAEIIVAYDRMMDNLPDCYKKTILRLQLEKKEMEIIGTTAKGIVHDILNKSGADLIFEGSELKFSLIIDNVPYPFHTTLSTIREDLESMLDNF